MDYRWRLGSGLLVGVLPLMVTTSSLALFATPLWILGVPAAAVTVFAWAFWLSWLRSAVRYGQGAWRLEYLRYRRMLRRR